jgi:GGDEF domain-containing protein
LNNNHRGPEPRGTLGDDPYFDDISGVYNRKYLFCALEWELTHGHPISVIIVDLD